MSTPAEPPKPSHAADADLEGHALGSHRLGPHVVGQRVVVRRVLPGQVGPTGGPAFTDVLGECLSWGRGLCEVRTEDGTVVSVHLADIVSGKPVPPRASVRMRVPARELHQRAHVLFPDLEVLDDDPLLGAWVLRRGGLTADGRATKRGNSVLAVGDPGVPLADAAGRASVLCAERGLAPLALLVRGSDEEARLLALGWRAAGGAAEVQVAATSRVQRALSTPPPVAELTEVSAQLAQAVIGEAARVRVGLDDTRGEVWACLADLWVSPGQRRTGLARAVLAEAVDWAASRGATTLHLQVESANVAAQALYRSLGFGTHHAYQFLELN